MLSKTMAILLGIIKEQPVNAYELTKVLSRLNVRNWYNIPDSTVYATIRTAEKKGYIQGSVEKSGNMPDKTVFTLTEMGAKELTNTLVNFIEHFEYDIIPFIIAGFFIGILEKDSAVIHLKKRMKVLQKYSNALEEELKNAKQQDLPDLVICNLEHCIQVVKSQLQSTPLFIETIISQK